MKKILSKSDRKFIDDLHLLFKTSSISNSRHSIFEAANFICDGQKVFDLYCPPKKIIAFLRNFAENNSNHFFVFEVEDRIFLVRKKYSKLFREYVKLRYSKKKKDRGRSGELYGILMGYPKTAAIAWHKDTDREDNNRKHLLNIWACAVVTGSLKDIGLMNFVFSANDWQEEYKHKIKTELHVCNAFPKIFKPVHAKKNEKYVLEIKNNLRKKNLFKHMKPVHKAAFIACASAAIPFDEKRLICQLAEY